METISFDWGLSDSHPFRIQFSRHNPGRSSSFSDMHSSVHIGLLLKGDTTGLLNGEKITVREGGIYLTSPWEQHRSIFSEEGNNLLLVTADPDAVDRALLSGAEKLNILYRTPPGERQKILDKVKIPAERSREIVRMLEEQDLPERELKLWHAVLGIFVEIAVLKFSAVPDPDYIRMLPALKHLGRQHTSVDQAAECCHLSASRFAHLFRRVFGMSFAQYERLYRLRRAIDEMHRFHAGLKETAESWGFCDKSHFSKVRRKYFGTARKK